MQSPMNLSKAPPLANTMAHISEKQELRDWATSRELYFHIHWGDNSDTLERVVKGFESLSQRFLALTRRLP